eukprot:scaffold1194_cov189-Alexandrium_tamarense.AAC.10
MSTQARGLNNFISDLRNSKSKLEESNRVEVELAKIRKKFNPGDAKLAADGSNPSLSSYQRKKYVWKLVYIHVLGYDVDFGHAEVLALVRSKKYSEKVVGYVALSLLLRGSDPIMSTVIDTMKSDLTTAPGNVGKNSKGGVKNDATQCLALCSLANISGLELIQAMHVEVQHILVSKSSTDQVKKKSALCLLRLTRTSPNLISGREFAPHIGQLLQETHLGVLTSVMSLLNGLALQQTDDYEILIPHVVHILSLLVMKKACEKEYGYYNTPSPWLQIKLLKFLQYYPNAIESHDIGMAASGNEHVNQLINVVSKILMETDDADISVRRRALDLLFVICDTDNAERIVDELVAHLVVADASIREEMVLKIAILAEKYATDLRWYVDTILKLISISGDYVSDPVWHRVVQIVTNHPQGDLQGYAAATLFVAATPQRCHETTVRVAAYILVFARSKNSVDVEVQQRCAEYASMREAFSPEAVEDLLREMPPFEDKRRSALEMRLLETEGENSATVAKASVPSEVEQQRALAASQMLSGGPIGEEMTNGMQPIEEQEDEQDVSGEQGASQEEEMRAVGEDPSGDADDGDQNGPSRVN